MVKSHNKKQIEQVAEIHFHVDKQREFSRFIKYLSHPVSIAWRNFLAGTFQGLGILFGTAIFLSVITFLLKQVLGEIPFFSDLSLALSTWMESVLNAPK